MGGFENPALKSFVAEIGNELILTQVLIRRRQKGFELRHVADREAAEASLRLVTLAEARTLAQFTASGEFRPLKSAPTLVGGWRMVAVDDTELDVALSRLYPGAVADWYAVQSATPPVTHYREFVDRQSGMYRITAMLTDAQAADVVRAVCDTRCCLKRRLWTVPGLTADAAAEKTIIPCLEPCAVLMEAARKAVRTEQEENRSMKLAETEKTD